MHELIRISTLGLSRNEQMSLSSMLKLTAEIRARYRLGDPGDPAADLIFVNADLDSAVSELKIFQQTNKSLVAIMVTSTKNEIPDEIAINRPLVFKKIMDVLKIAILLPRVRGSAVVETVGIPSIKKILVVDDSFPVRKYMEQKIPLLSQGPIDLSFAASGEEAMAMIRDETPDLIFLDVVMPGADGYKICKWIKSIRPETQVAMLTSKSSPFDKVRGLMSGCDNYLTKPPEDDKLEKILTKQ